ncbi:MAG: sigma-54-dependent Fis family transcriptional regulator [Blastocatellia bacterium]|nr:sigma-54-dependent Fis family transcriptional regulator [Blastocatellia bacterium]
MPMLGQRKSNTLRILVLDDNIGAVSGDIRSALREHLSVVIDDLTGLGGKDSSPFLVPNLISGEKVFLIFRCNKVSDAALETVRAQIEAGTFGRDFDLVLLDDNWRGHDFGGQEVLLPLAFANLHGSGEGLPIVALFTQHWDTDRIQRYFRSIFEGEIDWNRIAACPKNDPIQFISLLFRALGTKRASLQHEETMEALIEAEVALQVIGSSKNKYPEIVGDSKPMIALKRLIDRVAESDGRIVIEGESGVGKELVAKAIHNNSSRKDKTFIGLNCGALAETLLESELFGHKKGSFTGATENKIGFLQAGNGGTLFLDEINNMSPALQAKLLRALQEKEVMPVGATSPVPFDTRIISASSENLEGLVNEGRFRGDLYYRLNVVPLYIPPLRDRKGDLPALVDHFLKRFRIGNCFFSEAAVETLSAYQWPGNVRELENVIERVSIIRDKNTQELSIDLLPDNMKGDFTPLVNREFDGKAIFEECLRLEVIRDNSKDKKYKLMLKLCEAGGEEVTDEELRSIGFEPGSTNLSSTQTVLRKSMIGKEIGWKIASGRVALIRDR